MKYALTRAKVGGGGVVVGEDFAALQCTMGCQSHTRRAVWCSLSVCIVKSGIRISASERYWRKLATI